MRQELSEMIHYEENHIQRFSFLPRKCVECTASAVTAEDFCIGYHVILRERECVCVFVCTRIIGPDILFLSVILSFLNTSFLVQCY